MAAYVHDYKGPETPTRSDRKLTRAETLTDQRIFVVDGDYSEGRFVLAAMTLRNLNGGHRLSLNAPDDGNAVKISATGDILDYKVDAKSFPVAAYNSQIAIKEEVLFWMRQRGPR